MQLLVFVTDNGTPDGTGPLLFMKNEPRSLLPTNPRSLEWRYLATISSDDTLIVGEGPAARRMIEADGYYIANHLL